MEYRLGYSRYWWQYSILYSYSTSKSQYSTPNSGSIGYWILPLLFPLLNIFATLKYQSVRSDTTDYWNLANREREITIKNTTQPNSPIGCFPLFCYLLGSTGSQNRVLSHLTFELWLPKTFCLRFGYSFWLIPLRFFISYCIFFTAHYTNDIIFQQNFISKWVCYQ